MYRHSFKTMQKRCVAVIVIDYFTIVIDIHCWAPANSSFEKTGQGVSSAIGPNSCPNTLLQYYYSTVKCIYRHTMFMYILCVCVCSYMNVTILTSNNKQENWNCQRYIYRNILQIAGDIQLVLDVLAFFCLQIDTVK